MAMSPVAKVATGMGVAILVVFLLPFPSLITWLLVGGILALPVVGYFTLTQEQRRRITRLRSRGQLGK